MDTSERTRPYARLNSGPFTGPAVFAFDGERDRFLFGEDGATTCGLTALDRSTGDLDSLTTEVCPQAILPDPNEGTLWISNRDSRPLFGIIEGVWRVAMDGSSAQPFSGPDRGAGAPLEDPSPGSLLLDPGGRALLALDRNAVASVDIPSGDRAVAFSSLQDTGRARLNPNLDRGLVVIERNDTFVSVDLEVGTKDVWFRTPDGLAGAFAIDGPNRRLFYARTGVFEPGAILVIDTASGEWAVHAR